MATPDSLFSSFGFRHSFVIRASECVITGLRIALARLRFFFLLGAVLAVVAGWPWLRNVWDTLTGPAAPAGGVSPDIEYWCPMCPGVLSDWPGKCPVCHMTLVLRQKGEMTPLPDGVVARMQFSPYRVQLAGIHVSPVAYRALGREFTLASVLATEAAKSTAPERLTLAGDVFENDIGLLQVGQKFEVTSEAFPERAFAGRLVLLAPQVSPVTRSLRIGIEIENPRQELRPGMLVTARARVPLASLASTRQLALDAWRERTAATLLAAALASPFGTTAGAGLDALTPTAVEFAALEQGLVLAIPESAVIDTGARKVVFLERAPGMFDAVEVWLGRRCGDAYPVLGGLQPGQAVVTAGAFLLDAETRLNPAAATGYFGAASRGGAASATPTAAVTSNLSAQDQQLVKKQKVCPVMGQPLGSMGVPYRVVVEGRTVFLCCEGCAPTLKKDPQKYLAKLPK